MIIRKDNIYRNIPAEKFKEYSVKGYIPIDEEPTAKEKPSVKEKPKK